jgi:hypothetical protein
MIADPHQAPATLAQELKRWVATCPPAGPVT